MTPEQIAKNGSEHAEQAALFQWAAITANQCEACGDHKRAQALRMMFAIPNGDQRGSGDNAEDRKRGAQIAGARLKAEGQKNGVPDVCMPWPIQAKQQEPSLFMKISYCGLFIEMKARKHKSKRGDNPMQGCSEDQIEWIDNLRALGYRCEVCYGWEEARDVIISYLQ